MAEGLCSGSFCRAGGPTEGPWLILCTGRAEFLHVAEHRLLLLPPWGAQSWGGTLSKHRTPPRGAFCPARCRSRVSGALRAVEQRIEEVCWCRLCPPSASCYQSHGVLQNQRRKRPPLALSHKEFRLEQGSESEPRNNPRPPQPCVGAPDFSPATQEPKLRVTEQLSHKREPG